MIKRLARKYGLYFDEYDSEDGWGEFYFCRLENKINTRNPFIVFRWSLMSGNLKEDARKEALNWIKNINASVLKKILS